MLCTLALSALLLHGQTDSVLDRQPELSKKITVEYPAQRVEDVLKDLSEKTGVHLVPTVPIREDALVLYAEEMPARDLLRKIAEHFNWTWEAGKDALILGQSARQETLKEKALPAGIARAYATWQKKAIDASKAPPSTGVDVAAYRDLLEEWRKFGERDESNATPEQRMQFGAQLRSLSTRGGALGRRISPAWRMADAVVASLTAADFAELDRTSRLVFSYSPTLWQHGLPNSAKQYVDALLRAVALESEVDRNTGAYSFQRLQDFGYEPMRKFSPDEVATVRVTLSADRVREPSFDARAGVRVAIIAKSGELLSDRSLSISEYGGGLKEPPKGPAVKDEFDAPLVPTEELSALVANPKNYRFLRPEQDALAEFLKLGSKVLPISGAARILIAAAKAGHVPLVADAYDPRGYPGVFWRTATLRQAFDGFASRMKEDWSRNGAWVEFRTKDWEWARNATIPASTLFALRDIVGAKGAKPMDTATAVASLISDHQVSGWYLNYLLYRPTSRDIAMLLYGDDTRYALRFLGSLSSADRKSLEGGRSMRYGSLSPGQRDLLAAFVYRMNDRDFKQDVYFRAGGPDGLEKGDVDWIRANWTAFGHQPQRGYDSEPSQQYPNGLPADVTISVRTSTTGALLLGTQAGMSMVMTEAHFLQSGYYGSDNGDLRVQAATQDRIFLTVDASPLATKGLEFGLISAILGSGAVAVGQLPDEVKNRLKKAYDSQKKGGG